MSSHSLAVLGAGSWGTALSIILSPRYDQVRLWVHEPDLAASMRVSRENGVYLPGLALPSAVAPTSDLGEALAGADTVLGVMPSRFARRIYTEARPFLTTSMRFVSATKGIEHGTLLRMSQVLQDCVETPVAVLSGPTFAREVARGEPAAVVVSSDDRTLAAEIQSRFSGPTLRLYTNFDPIGVELGGALKNVIAIGAGICQGLGLGNNSLAALITRGLAEITRLAVQMGGQPATLAGLAGLGDLVLTCTGELSRNRAVGIALAQGRSLPEITGSMKMIAEGVDTTVAAVGLARRHLVTMPITDQMHLILSGERSPRDALRELMERSLKEE